MSHNTINRRKHVPQRTCVACRKKFNKGQVTRLVYRPDGLQVDETGKLNGRGAYLCDDAQCRKRAQKSNLLDRALRTSIPKEEKQFIIERLSS